MTIRWQYIVASMLIVCPCGVSHRRSFSEKERYATDSIVKKAKTVTGLDSLLETMRKRNDRLGEMVVLREKGKLLRDESQFSDALQAHGEGLKMAEQVGDTIEWVKAMNNIGTDYRRMGILDMAQRYHYGAYMMAKECADTSYAAKKNLVISLNGLANVYMTTHNLGRADSVLRLALAGEVRLGSLTGQAINYANLGSIFEARGKTDSAWAYYRKSMLLNQRDNNTLGVSLCHTYFGDLYRKARNYDAALREYQQSYELMKDSKDEWHALNSLIALARVYGQKGDDAKAMSYLDEAQTDAKKIGSNEHLAEIYKLYYMMYKQRGDFRTALSYHELSGALEDSLIDMDKVNHMQNTSLMLERDQQERRVAEANNRLVSEKATRRIAYAIFVIVVLLMGSFIAMLVYSRHVRAKSHKALKKLNEVREAFFTNITHEFRTPLTVILGLSHDLQQPATTTDEAQDMGRTIERQGQRMLRLINQLLDISKIKSEIGTPEWRSGDIVAYIGMIVETYTSYADRQGIKLQYIAREKHVETAFVPDYISKVISNLLSNSLKFTPSHGTINVSLWLEGQTVRIDVVDNGRGIPETSLSHIFEEFYQADNIDDGVGTGVGLALVHHIIKSLGGTISVDSTVGKGTTFHINIPLASPSVTPSPSPILPLSKGEPSDEPTRILVIEDNADIAAYIGKQFDSSYYVDYAANGKDGLVKAHEWMPDIIITDLMMPVMDGLELCKQIRSDELTCHIPIIVVTAKVTEKERIEGLKAGADAYLVKPFNSEELTTRVEKLLEQRQMLRARFAKEMDNVITKTGNTDSSKTNVQNSKAEELDRKFLTKVTDSIYLMLNSRKSVDVNAVASQLCMSYGQFNRKLFALTGYTPAQYIQRIKIKKAQRMLVAHPEYDFNTVAMLCGFSDYSNFVRAFKNVLNLTPTQYVRNL